jgi:hypothetical protein
VGRRGRHPPGGAGSRLASSLAVITSEDPRRLARQGFAASDFRLRPGSLDRSSPKSSSLPAAGQQTAGAEAEVQHRAALRRSRAQPHALENASDVRARAGPTHSTCPKHAQQTNCDGARGAERQARIKRIFTGASFKGSVAAHLREEPPVLQPHHHLDRNPLASCSKLGLMSARNNAGNSFKLGGLG